jgi:tetratricopeptide (TPR) repeat protein
MTPVRSRQKLSLPSDRRSELERLVAAAREAASEAALSGPITELLVGAVTGVGTAVLGLPPSHAPASERAVVEYLREVQRSWEALEERLRELQRVEARRPEPWGDEWWSGQIAALNEALEHDARDGSDRWLRLFARVLLAGHLDGCERLLAEPLTLLPEAGSSRAVLGEGTTALRQGRNLDALPMLAHLRRLRSFTTRKALLDANDRALLRVFSGHALLSELDFDSALLHFERARDAVPGDARPVAALGDLDYARAQADPDNPKQVAKLLRRAERHYLDAQKRSGREPEGLIGLGLVYEARKQWLEADDLYERAATAFGDDLRVPNVSAVIGRRLGPTSGNLLLQVARTVSRQGNLLGALDAVEQALRHPQQLAGEGLYPERLAYRLQADVLERLKRWPDSAVAYFEAGTRFAWRGDYAMAVDLLTKAKEHDRDRRSAISWHLSDSLAAESNRPQPPFVDEKQLEASLREWEAAGELPGSDYSWAYLTRAFIAQQTARLPRQDRKSLWWQAATYVERALVLRPDDEQNWRFLNDYQDQLGLQSGSRDAARRAFELQPTPEAASALIVSFVNAGEFDRARTWLKRFHKLLPPSTSKEGSQADATLQFKLAWQAGVQGLILSREGEFEDARKRFDQAFAKLAEAAMPEVDYPVWFQEERALCLRMLQRWSLAESDYRSIWIRYHEDDRDNQASFGRAAYSLGKLDEAIGIFQALARELNDISHAYLGLCLIANGELAAGAKELSIGIDKAKNQLELDDLLQFEFPELAKFIPFRDDGEALRQAIDDLSAQARARRTVVERPQSPTKELENVVTELLDHGETTGPAWVGAHAGLARLHVEGKRWRAAGRAYRVLGEAGSEFPEARAAVDAAMLDQQRTGDRRFGEGDTRAALDAYKGAWVLARESGLASPAQMADIQSRLSIAKWDTDEAAARVHLTRAIVLFRDSGTPQPGRAVAITSRPLLRDIDHYWAVDAAWEVSGVEDVQAARDELARFLDERLRLDPPAVEAFDTRPVVEIGWGLVPEDTGPTWSLFSVEIPGMRSRVESELGVRVPGIWVRASNDIATNGYGVLLNDFPFVRRVSVPLELRYSTAPPGALGSAEGDGSVLATTDPVSGAPASWVTPAVGERLEREGFPAAREPLAYVVRHLEAVLRRSLPDFVGLDELERLLDPVLRSDRGAAAVAAAAPDPQGRVRLSRVLRALLRERVPITPIENVLHAVRHADERNSGHTLDEVVRSVRLHLRDSLPGNAAEATRLTLPADLDAAVGRLLARGDDQTVVVTDPHAPQDVLWRIEELIGPAGPHAVLVTSDPILRPYLYRLMEPRLPTLTVLSQEEVSQAAADG